jgi:hypothetical protein
LTPQVHGSGQKRPDYLDPEVELQVGDVRDPKAVARALEGVDSVYHLAAAVGVGQSMYAIADYTSDKGATSTTASFVNRDALGLTTVDKIHVVSGAPAEVMVIAEENYLLYAGDMTALRQHAVVTATDSSPGLDLAFPHTPFGKYYIVVNSDRPVEVSYTVHKALSPTFVAFVTLFATLFIGFYTIWIVTAFRIRKNYAKGAIYR